MRDWTRMHQPEKGQMTNHHLNARSHHERWCPECDAKDDEACRDENGRARAPHRMRQRMRDGELFVVHRDDALASRKLKAFIQLVATIATRARRAGRFVGGE